jgi:hypothetical protein
MGKCIGAGKIVSMAAINAELGKICFCCCHRLMVLSKEAVLYSFCFFSRMFAGSQGNKSASDRQFLVAVFFNRAGIKSDPGRGYCSVKFG